uniref:Extended synaptotagmin-3 n=1 Tax=Denticeps clupeoides TaxID=299321 RepID=A0AAY4B4T8_9TELE
HGSEGQIDKPGQISAKDVNRILMEFLIFLGRSVLFLYPVYLTGSLGLSISWVLLILTMWTVWKNNRKWKDARLDTAVDFLENEKHVINQELKSLNMPAWINFSEVEKAQWINKILQQAWPFFGMYMEKLLKENIQASVRNSSVHLKTFTFTKVHFGQKAPRVTGVRVYTHEVENMEVILDLNLVYEGDLQIDASVKPPITAGVKDIQIEGMLRVILDPLVGQIPLVGGITMFFIRRPTFQVNWTGMTNLLDSPALRHFSESSIVDIIASIMVLPNRLCIPLIDQVKVDEMRFPLPRGVVRVSLLEARDLVAKDTYMMGLVKGKSDPYAILRVGNNQFKSKTIKENLNPQWHEVYEFVVHEAPGQELEAEVYDEDKDSDDFLGRFSLDFGEVKREKKINKWFKLEDIESGEVHLNLQWLSLQTDTSLLVETQDGCACAMLALYLDNASNLPKDNSEFTHNDKHGKHPKEAKVQRKQINPSSYAEISIDQQSKKSKVVFTSKDPVWEECFTFFVHSVNNQVLKVQVKVHEKKTLLGVVTLPLNRLLNAPDMTLDQSFLLERSGANSQLKMKATMRILKPEKPETKVLSKPPSKTEAKPQAQAQKEQSQPILQSQPQRQQSQVSQPDLTSTMPNQASSSSEPQTKYTPHRRGSLLAFDGQQTAPSTPNQLRRYDSQSLLSENAIAHSRLDLTNGLPYPEAIINHKGSFGAISLTVRYANLRNKLVVVVNSCRNLFPCSENGTDSYVRLYLLPDQTWRHRLRTQVKKKTVNPSFDEKFEFTVPIEDAKTRKLDVSVKNNRMFHTRERKDIGMVLVDLSQVELAKGLTEWFELTLPGLKKTS